ncbi:hypothetical protein Aau02nite_20170 [Amorphoplanes auranticolor]|uniref:Uncharacterized protein n=1 Tax=Actinoplanes auranticolor TaxID=47988 RepID=A0A919VJV5_9ACTN|nr:hypothetical protein Aau02nite_20170 [Actinoplanes auranticolor]
MAGGAAAAGVADTASVAPVSDSASAAATPTSQARERVVTSIHLRQGERHRSMTPGATMPCGGWLARLGARTAVR